MPINVNGSDAAETFSARSAELSGGNINGGGGTDILELRDFFYPQLFDFTTLATFKNVEVIRGVIEEAQIRIRVDQLADVTTIDSDGTAHLDQVMIVGNDMDLSTKAFVGRLEILPETANASVKVADYAMASLIRSTVRGTKVQIASGTLTQEQRVALHDRGIDKVTDASGVTTEVSGPVVTGLQGDASTYKGGEMFLDAGANATVQSVGHLKSLVVNFVGTKSLFDLLDVETNSRLQIQGKNAEGNNRLFVDGVEIGDVVRDSFEGSLHFTFNGSATAERVQVALRAVSYQYDFSFPRSSGELGVEFALQDAGGRVAKSTSTIKFEGQIGTPTDPDTDTPGTSGKNVTGTDGNDALTGSAGDDVIRGLKGLDTLTGGAGKDAFVFDTKLSKSNIDRITDFSVADDTIWLDNAVLTKLGKKTGALKKAHFFKGAKARDKDDYLVYDSKKGALYYDKDGSGASKAVQIASLNKKLLLTYKDFFVI